MTLYYEIRIQCRCGAASDPGREQASPREPFLRHHPGCPAATRCTIRSTRIEPMSTEEPESASYLERLEKEDSKGPTFSVADLRQRVQREMTARDILSFGYSLIIQTVLVLVVRLTGAVAGKSGTRTPPQSRSRVDDTIDPDDRI